MAGAIELLKFQLLAYWRRVFSARGKYDKLSFVLILIILLAGYRFVVFLNQTAKSFAEGNTENLNTLLAIIFFAWVLPALESQKATEKLADFAFLPITQTQFSLISLANIFLVPTSIIAFTVSFATLYPILFAKNIAFGIFGIFLFSLFSAFSLTLLARLLKLRVFRILMFLATILLIILSWKTEFGGLTLNIPILAILTTAAFIFAFIATRQTFFSSAESDRRIVPQFVSKISLPIKFGEMIKKDFFAMWKVLDSYIALLTAIFYAIVLILGDVSFLSFSIAISVLLMMNGSLVFNIFGLENSAGFQRLSLLPIKPEDLFKAKNKVFAMLVFSQTFFLFPLIFYKFGLIYLCAAILKTVATTLFYMAWGNQLSLKFPFKINFYEVSLGGSLQDMMMAVVVLSSISIAPEFIFYGNQTAILLINTALVSLGFIIYNFSLSRVSAKLFAEWENIGFKLS